jgi:hypothetical protein
MWRLMALLLFALHPLGATWALVHSASNASCSAGTTCTVTVTSTGAGNLLVGTVLVGNTGLTISSVSGGGTWTHCGTCQMFNATAGGTDASYTLSSTSGATSIVFTLSASNSGGAWVAAVLEYSYTAGPISFDAASTRNQSTASASQAGVALTLTGSNDVIVQTATEQSSASAISAPYTQPALFPSGDGVAGAINTASGTAPTWTATSGQAGLMGIAFKESGGGGGSPTMPPRVL